MICLTKSDVDQDLPTYNAPIYLRTKCSERKKRCGPNKKKFREVKSGSQFALRIWSASPFAQEAGLNIYNARIYWSTKILCVSLIDKVIAYSLCWRERKRKYVSQWQPDRSKWKWSSIATVPDLCPTTVKILTHLSSRYHLPLKGYKLEIFVAEFLHKQSLCSVPEELFYIERGCNSRTEIWERET